MRTCIPAYVHVIGYLPAYIRLLTFFPADLYENARLPSGICLTEVRRKGRTGLEEKRPCNLPLIISGTRSVAEGADLAFARTI